MIRTALLSVSDKNGIVEFAQALHQLGVKLISTGGTAKLLTEKGIPVTEVSTLTGFPEMLDGRVKTLHPKVHGGLLARRDSKEHMAAIKEHGIETIDLLAINLYPFTETITKSDCSFEDAVENIDIGGPAMLRAAAKNHQDVTVLVSPSDYSAVLDEMRNNQNTVSYASNLAYAKKVFAHTAQYDGAIANYLSSLNKQQDHSNRNPYPKTLHLAFERVQEMRYGENPHQSAAISKRRLVVLRITLSYKAKSCLLIILPMQMPLGNALKVSVIVKQLASLLNMPIPVALQLRTLCLKRIKRPYKQILLLHLGASLP